MDTNGRLVAGSHNRNEFVLINADDTARVSVIPSSFSQTCLLFNTCFLNCCEEFVASIIVFKICVIISLNL